MNVFDNINKDCVDAFKTAGEKVQYRIGTLFLPRSVGLHHRYRLVRPEGINDTKVSTSTFIENKLAKKFGNYVFFGT